MFFRIGKIIVWVIIVVSNNLIGFDAYFYIMPNVHLFKQNNKAFSRKKITETFLFYLKNVHYVG